MKVTLLRFAIAAVAFGACLLTLPGKSDAQKTRTVARVGWLEVCAPGPRRPNIEIFRARLAELGLVEGKNLVIEQRFADCHYERMPALALELVQSPVDVLFTIGTRATRIVAATVKTTPIVAYSCDPFVHVSRLAHPGGNLTGVTCMTTELMPKRLELIKELIPGLSRVTLLQDPEAATNAYELTRDAAKSLGVEVRVVHVLGGEGLAEELASVEKEKPDALLIYPDMVISTHPRPQQLGDFAIRARLPTMHAFRFYAEAGGLMSYGANLSEVYTAAAEQVTKIISGVPPGDLPLRQATRFELVINSRTARQLGITIPQSLLARADEIIE